MDSLLVNAGPIAHMAGEGPIIGQIHDQTEYVHPSGLAILISDFKIEKISESEELLTEYTDVDVIDLEGKAVVPGLVDAHTHLLWAGDRSREVGWKQQGMTYREIAENGGGISATVLPTRKASDSQLAHLGVERMREALRNGTTHMEAISRVTALILNLN
ncbi:MAG: hypothetical protein CM15mP1_2910 [Methanobacteriota archaeon]|nr:MAG: hypothetical protein CM15mP1_2910 [Euryarchaeota archaeon]